MRNVWRPTEKPQKVPSKKQPSIRSEVAEAGDSNIYVVWGGRLRAKESECRATKKGDLRSLASVSGASLCTQQDGIPPVHSVPVQNTNKTEEIV